MARPGADDVPLSIAKTGFIRILNYLFEKDGCLTLNFQDAMKLSIAVIF